MSFLVMVRIVETANAKNKKVRETQFITLPPQQCCTNVSCLLSLGDRYIQPKTSLYFH